MNGNFRQLDDQYNPQTCVTAQEMRSIGIAIPHSIPNNAWIPRRAIKFSTVDYGYREGDVVQMTMHIHLDAPFKWISVSGEVPIGQ